MSDYSSMATLQNNSVTGGFAAALQRAKLVAAKIEVGGNKRSLDDGPEPSSKKLAAAEPPYSPPQMSVTAAAAAAAAAAARLAANSASPPAPSGPPNMMNDQAINDYIRVPDKMVGLIIGRGGEQITRLQAETGCKIQMAPDSGQAERLCTLTGSQEAIARAKELVNNIVNHRGRENAPQHPEQGMSPMGPRGGGGGGGGVGGLGITDEIMLPGPKVGLIIGKNGKTIKQLQEQSGAKMVVIQDGPNTEYEKPLRISGDPAKVEHAKQLVYELLQDKEGGQGGGRGFDDNYAEQGNGVTSSEVLVPKTAVGVVIGRNGDMIKKIQSDSGCRVQFHQEREEGPGDKRCYLQGLPHQVDHARQMIEDLINSVNVSSFEQLAIRSGRGRAGKNNNPGNDRDSQQWQDNTPEVRVTFSMPNVKCGLIIGRGGEVIKQINAQSGAHCELDRRAQNQDRVNRTFFIKGHPDAVESCKRIIMEKVGMPVNFIPDGGPGSDNGNGGNNGGGEYYRGGGGGGGEGGGSAWGYNPHWHQQQQQQQQVQINPATGQPDYSQQWIDYYRSLGLMREAEAIEQQAKQQQMGGPNNQSNSGSPSQTSGPASTPPSSTPSNAPDYSAQWAEYYRSIGKLKEADAIEAQIKAKQPPTQQPPQPTNAPQAAPSQSPGAMGQYQYPMYPPVYPYPYPYGNAPDSGHQ
ncbi:far upstream element-binding protein 1 isoform X2 [Pieris brassicae]|uniref:far upstream element-binding protein 1 isoform X2 n=1 Tax=Pieris brassicae TaxID=7116 RepID=UPI001E65FE9F|nr:far upstream element-binding protein 1 isoform X2 [Pieris brassicae]